MSEYAVLIGGRMKVTTDDRLYANELALEVSGETDKPVEVREIFRKSVILDADGNELEAKP